VDVVTGKLDVRDLPAATLAAQAGAAKNLPDTQAWESDESDPSDPSDETLQEGEA
jgi:hypothetical protein